MRRPVRSRAPAPLQRWQYREARPDGGAVAARPAALAAGGEWPDGARRDVTERDDERGQDEGASGVGWGCKTASGGGFGCAGP